MSSEPIHDRIKTPRASEPNTPSISVKSELQPISLSRVFSAVKLRTLNQGGREILELISESEAEDSDPDSTVEVTEALMQVYSRSSSTIPQSDTMDTEDQGPNDGDGMSIDTLWQDEISSFVRTGQFSVTQKLKVQRIEYLSELPSVWPIPRVPTAFVIDLADERYDIADKDGDLLPVDCIIRDADNDGWKSVPGSGDSTARVTFDPGQPPIVCRRARSNCRGAFTCESLDAGLLKDVVRYELDPASRNAILTA
ncbi:hypothetical protein B0H13DRAFT_2318980 [Mycena leptocephala]|nr:hypothetical protein B0H13DRAFT_2318980 [Mycena leptocephala]